MAAFGLLTTLLVHIAALSPSPEPPDELPFVPGMVMALGSPEAASVTSPNPSPNVAEPTEPVEPTTQEQPTEPTEPVAVDDAVTEDVTPPAPRRPAKPKPSTPPPSSKRPRLPPKPSLPSLPSRGDPFGDPRGFDELSRSGDDWARGVIAALDAMNVGTVYAKPIAGSVRFQMTICKDGRVSRVSYKGGSASHSERDLVLLEVERLKIPRPPAAIAAKMKSHCVKLRHTFNWSTKGTR